MKTKEKILRRALELFNESGLTQVGVREIARSLEISVGNLSYHFPRKEDIVLALMEELRAANEAVYQDYFNASPTLDRFLATLRRIFENQYHYRGVLIGHDEINQLIKKHFDYRAVEQRRRQFFHRIFRELAGAGELALREGDIEFLISFMTLFGRFWLLEASISFADRSREAIIDHYEALIRRQLELFAAQENPAG